MGCFALNYGNKNKEESKYLAYFNNFSDIKCHKVMTRAYGQTLTVDFIRKGETICYFTLTEFQGNPFILFSTNTYVLPKYRNKGAAKAMQEVKKKICKDNHITLLLATVLTSNFTQRHVLKKAGWKMLTAFGKWIYEKDYEAGAYILYGLHI